MRVSVTIPAYRSAATLPQTIESVLRQDMRDWELVVVDDGSPDRSAEIVAEYARRDARVRLIRQANAGVCAARNTGIASSRGEMLLFLDADDWLEDDALSALTSACDTAAADVVHALCRFVRQDGTPTDRLAGHTDDQPLFNALAASNVLPMPSMLLLRRAVLEQVGAFDPSLKHCGDWDLWQRIARSAARLAHLGQVVTSYRMTPASLSRSPATLLRDGITVLRRIHGPDPRVKNPNPAFAEGYDPQWLDARIAYFAIYTTGLAIADGDVSQIAPLLDRIDRWPRLDPPDVASCLFWSLCFAHCASADQAVQFWPGVRQPVQQLLQELENRTATRRLAEHVVPHLNTLARGAIGANQSNRQFF